MNNTKKQFIMAKEVNLSLLQKNLDSNSIDLLNSTNEVNLDTKSINQDLKIFNFYAFNNIKKTNEELQKIRILLLTLCKDNNILGTILISDEGFNGQISGASKDIDFIYNKLLELNLYNFNYKFANVTFVPFAKLKIKIKNDIISIGCKLDDINKNVGKYISPEKWDEQIFQSDAIIIDTRNDYEFNAGTFKGAINPNINTFREFPAWIEQNFEKLDLKNKKIYMFCTGGIRCEKSTTFLQEKYNIESYHLKGGILDYLYETKNKNNMWVGNCFVFDDRILVTKQDYCNDI